jgi:hypothetical protein
MNQRPSSVPRALLLAGLCAAGGCLDDCGGSGDYDPQPGPGELGNGEFHYYCLTDDDPACSDGPGVGDFPARVAVGGRFRLTYTWDDAAQPAPTLRSSVPERLAVDDDTFTPLAAGFTAVLAVVGNSDIGDLIHLHAGDPERLAVQVDRVDYVDYELAEGAEVRFAAIARDDDDYILAGALAVTFTLDDPTVAEFVGGTGAHTVVRALAPGQTVLRATLGALTTEVALTVLAPEDPTDGDTTGSSSTGGSTGEPDSSGSSGSTDATGSTGSGDSTGGVL